MKRTSLTLVVVGLPITAFSGCIRPVIMGECEAQIVEWDTHPQGQSNTPPAPAGFYYEQRGTGAEQQNLGPSTLLAVAMLMIQTRILNVE